MAELPETIMEERENKMVSPKGGNAVQKVAHFIKPMLSSSDPTPEKPIISLPFKPIISKLKFNGWRNPTHQWISWVDRLHSSYQFIWKSAGIYDAILSSRYKIVKNDDLFFGLAERWCSETNTFVFPWGEATVSLEDVMVLGGYSVLGDSVSGSVGEREFAEIEKKLVNAREEVSRGKSQKACQSQWMKHFMEGGSEIEHEAFLSLWLSRFVLPTYPFDTISKRFFKIAIHLARGTPIALAPVILASIYRDLSLLKSVMNSDTQVENFDNGDDLFMLTLWAPLQLVQVWAWERFPDFRPNPKAIEYGEPRLARWHAVNENEVGNVRPMLQSAGHSFEWRPYCKRVDNLPLPSFYRENEEWVVVGSYLGEDVLALARFVHVCELVGMDSIEQYNPHRVAMQFGFDQDVPQQVRKCSMNPDIPKRDLMQLAWLSYTNPIRDEILYVPSKFYEPMVTMRYLAWHRKGVLANLASFAGVLRKRRSSKRSRRLDEIKIKADVPPGFTPKGGVDHGNDRLLFGFPKKVEGNDSDFPPGFQPKSNGTVGFDIAKKDVNCPSNCMSKSLVKEESDDFKSEETSKQLLSFGYQNLHPCNSEFKPDGERLPMTQALETSVKIEPAMPECDRGSNVEANGGTPITLVLDDREEEEEEEIKKAWCFERVSALEDRIRRLERVLNETKAAKMR